MEDFHLYNSRRIGAGIMTEEIDNLFRHLKNRNKWDSWTFIFRIMDSGNAKLAEIIEIGESLGYPKAHIETRRSQYLDRLSPSARKYKKRHAAKRLKSELKAFIK